MGKSESYETLSDYRIVLCPICSLDLTRPIGFVCPNEKCPNYLRAR
jgi:hypothetical protein